MALNWTDITPEKPYDDCYRYQTLYELADNIFKQYKYNEPDTPDSAIQTDALPSLVYWLFNDYYKMFTEDEKYIADEFIRQFMIRFLNRCICANTADKFRSRVIYPLIANKRQLVFETTNWVAVNDTDGIITTSMTSTVTGTGQQSRNQQINGSKNDNGTSTSTNTVDLVSNTDSSGTAKTTVDKETSTEFTGNDRKTLGTKTATTQEVESSGTDNRTLNLTDKVNGTSTTDTNNSVDNNTTVTTDETVNTTGTSTDNLDSTVTDSNHSRQVHSIYPQSVVNASTVGNPDLTSWAYASDATDTNGGSTETTNSTTTTNNSSDTDRNGTVKTTGGTTETGKVSVTSDETKTNTGTDNLSKSSTQSTTGSVTNSGTDTTDSTSTTTQSDTGTDATETTDTTTQTNKGTDITESTHTNTSTDEQTVTGTDSSTTSQDTTQQTSTPQFSDIALLAEKFNFFDRYPVPYIYDVLDLLEKYFLSVYPDEYRDGYIDWTGYLNLTKYLEVTP